MSIEFDKRKEKNLIMMVEKSGVEDDKLKLTFNIDINNVKYGFDCKLKENKVIINVPALDSIVKDLKPGEYKATLDITGSDKYFMQPFNENIEVIDIPEVIVDKESLKETKLFMTVSELIDDGIVKIDEREIDKPDDLIEPPEPKNVKEKKEPKNVKEKKEPKNVKEKKEPKFNIETVKPLLEGNMLMGVKKPSNKKPISAPPTPKPKSSDNEDIKEDTINIVSKMFE